MLQERSCKNTKFINPLQNGLSVAGHFLEHYKLKLARRQRVGGGASGAHKQP